ncbi:acid protease [Dipodascopsis uninucleata]
MVNIPLVLRFYLLSTLLTGHASGKTEEVSGVVQFDIFKDVRPNEVSRHLRKRSEDKDYYFQQTLDNADYLYYVNVSIGTPPQPVRLHIDTGSSDMWIQSMYNELCYEGVDPCLKTGTFDPDSSTTYMTTDEDGFLISYGDYTYARGDFAKDAVHIGGITIQNMTMGVVTSGNTTNGIMGLGYPANEAIVSKLSYEHAYDNLPVLLVKQRFISSRTFSLWLNDLDASKGSILFGGIDTKKFYGHLVDFDILTASKKSDRPTPYQFYVELRGFGIELSGKDAKNLTDSEFSMPALLDSGTSFTYLPHYIIARLAKEIGFEENSEGLYIGKCSKAYSKDYARFLFNGLEIRVPLSELIFSDKSSEETIESSGDYCFISLFPLENHGIILGDTFLRSAYVVFDLDRNKISMAQTVFDQEESNIVPIGTNTSTANLIGVQTDATNKTSNEELSPGAVSTNNGSSRRNSNFFSFPIVVFLSFWFTLYSSSYSA